MNLGRIAKSVLGLTPRPYRVILDAQPAENPTVLPADHSFIFGHIEDFLRAFSVVRQSENKPEVSITDVSKCGLTVTADSDIWRAFLTLDMTRREAKQMARISGVVSIKKDTSPIF